MSRDPGWTPHPPLGRPMPEADANQVWDLLVAKAGANESDRHAFVHYLTEPNRFHEYRFIGLLGFGGKLHYTASRGAYISCYPEDSDEVRDAIIATVNAQLRELLGSGQ